MSRFTGLPDPSRDLVPLPLRGGFNLCMTLHSGQAFGWHPVSGGHAGVVDGKALFLCQEQTDAPVYATRTRAALATHYLALDHDLDAIWETFPNTPRMRQAADFCRGLRILRQPLWECMVSFIASSQKQVAHIRQIHRRLCERFGGPVAKCQGLVLFDFPSPERLADLNESALRGCGLGYRAKYLLETARRVAQKDFSLGPLTNLSTSRAREELMSLPGVGRKIANCILCFALERLDTVPVDVWVARILRESFVKRTMSLARLEEFATRRFGPFAGYAQQILFYHARSVVARRSAEHPSVKHPMPTLGP